MAEPWRGLLHQLSTELERQSAKLRDLELQNKRLLEAAALPVEMSEMPPIVQCDLQSPPGPERPGGDVRRSRRSQQDEDEDEVTGLKTDTILPHPHRQSKISEISQIALVQPRRNSRVSKLIESQQVRFMIMRAQRTREFGVKKQWFVINPDTNPFSTAWQIVTNFALAFVALITPLQVGLLEIHLDFLFVLTMMVDFVFVIDMILQFVTMYPRTTARGLEWELNPQKIAMNYLRTASVCWVGDEQAS
ncbi:hypothetical protein AK812_SmicGene19298 [Symbiodinium microadriaticum]|uniref:Uncharacterized protein n=1 Tax=Symbiodinium microadriaticum TaxID=2951 RepID=A0A1Q9DSW1_SYMMI|nr:hypothetical protein AK812_SmicGene19298 [Symbiodinium microadriaticum]CAE7906452.1 unnamed protein product [Symbiodinium microadriaticum]